LFFFSFSRHRDVVHHHASITLHAFVKSKIIFYKLYFILLVWFYNKPSSLFHIRIKN
jgi:hypothetical protein